MTDSWLNANQSDNIAVRAGGQEFTGTRGGPDCIAMGRDFADYLETATPGEVFTMILPDTMNSEDEFDFTVVNEDIVDGGWYCYTFARA